MLEERHRGEGELTCFDSHEEVGEATGEASGVDAGLVRHVGALAPSA